MAGPAARVPPGPDLASTNDTEAPATTRMTTAATSILRRRWLPGTVGRGGVLRAAVKSDDSGGGEYPLSRSGGDLDIGGGSADHGTEFLLVDHGHCSTSDAEWSPAGWDTQRRMQGELSAGLVQARLHRSGSAADGGGDLPLTEIGVVAQNDDDPKLRWQVLQGTDDVLGTGDTGRGVLGRRGGGQLVIVRSPVPVGDLLTELRVARVDDHPVEPRLDVGPVGEGVAESPRPQERLLDGLLGIEAVAQDQARRAERAWITLGQPHLEVVHRSAGNSVCIPVVTLGRPKRFGWCRGIREPHPIPRGVGHQRQRSVSPGPAQFVSSNSPTAQPIARSLSAGI